MKAPGDRLGYILQCNNDLQSKIIFFVRMDDEGKNSWALNKFLTQYFGSIQFADFHQLTLSSDQIFVVMN